jgi:muramoyltetrapeptide carboxypeptidase LdcA involved in peptidoglycan recycling
VGGAPVGDIPAQWVLPIGVYAELDATAGTLTLLETAVASRP